MKKVCLGAIACSLLFIPLLTGQQAKSHGTSAATIARGKYLVESVGLCQDCHTPRNEKGEFIKDQWLQGAVLGFKPIGPMPVWADKSVNIAGLPGWDRDAAIKFMMTGMGMNSLPARPPMPEYRFNRPDAEAVVGYLQSLKPAK